MRVRRASTHARRLSLISTPTAVVLGVTAVLASPTAGAVPAPRDGLPTAAASQSGRATPVVKASTESGLQVTSLAIPAVDGGDGGDGAPSAKALGLTTQPAGRMVAHVRQPAIHAFSMVGVTWDHDATTSPLTVEIRTLSDGVWGDWAELETDLDGGPLSSAEDSSFRDGTEPDWVGDATGLEVAVYGTGSAPRGLEVSTIDPGASPTSVSALAKAAPKDRTRRGTFPSMPWIVTRAQWGADESLGDECWDPKYGRTFSAAIVHHTAGSNDYRKGEAEAVVRGVYAYHTQSRGWCDIGYNFLVDRFGTIYEGRDGGIRQPVRGAHSGDYNVNTTGISLMGNFDIAQPTRKMKKAVVKLVSWRLGTAYHGPKGRPFVFDHRINRISGHRDVMSTACPGRYVYNWLPSLRRLVALRLGDYESKIERSWRTSAQKRAALGIVRIGEQGGGGGHWTTFQRGRMYYSDRGLKTFYNGPVLRSYVHSGETKGELGFPSTSVRSIRDVGSFAEFEGGRIYWSPNTGAKVLQRGRILHKYTTLHGSVRKLGFPTTGVVELANGQRTKFEHGSITYNATTQSTTVRFR